MCRYIEKNYFNCRFEHVGSGNIADTHVQEIAELFEIEGEINYIERVNDSAGVILLIKTGMEEPKRIPIRRISAEYYHLNELRSHVLEDEDKLDEILDAAYRAQEAKRSGRMTEGKAISCYLSSLKKAI
ncbi:hypothetical protein U472_00340 [Orenia metallireducens]|jgi:hypothetical protein|uniref:Uncharacterized protein n=1 Tax=Orenia metallireducens TaxID=1413210 RepID=A0A1C0ADD2_9FIRM|nr:hypothetical protein [Orenia metallireducens]OCL28639.1 hypothetical protein U472_00340 [Orenia metallireducens]